MGRFSRSKGQRGEREFARLMAGNLGRGVQRRLGQERDSGHDLVGIDQWAVQVKRCETLQINQWWKQTRKDASLAGLRPALAY
jgi:hypothetical protein